MQNNKINHLGHFIWIGYHFFLAIIVVLYMFETDFLIIASLILIPVFLTIWLTRYAWKIWAIVLGFWSAGALFLLSMIYFAVGGV